jgi:predicted transcriptional regulator
MSKMIAVRLDDELLARVDRERKRLRASRARVVHEALAGWVEQRRIDALVRREHAAYVARPVRGTEFSPVLRAQRWPR